LVIFQHIPDAVKRSGDYSDDLLFCEFHALPENAPYDLFRNSCSTDHCLNHLHTANRKPAGSMQLIDTEATISPYLQYTSNLIK